MCCNTCPFAFTDESEQVQNYGCIPSAFDIINMRTNHEKTWSCHMDYNKPCVGAIQYMTEKNIECKVVDKELVTAEDDWEKYV